MQEDVMLFHTELVIVWFMTLAFCLMADVLSLYTVNGRCQVPAENSTAMQFVSLVGPPNNQMFL